MAIGSLFLIKKSLSVTKPPPKPSDVTSFVVSVLDISTTSISEDTALGQCLRCKINAIDRRNVSCGHATTCDGCAHLECECSVCHKINKADEPLP